MKFKFITAILLFILAHSCVVQKEIYKSELADNFTKQKNKFVEKKGIEKKSVEDFKVYYSDQDLGKDYEVVSYNQVSSWIPFRPLIYKKWEVKYRLHQYMHSAYCLGILPTIDAMIVNEDLSGVKYIRYKDSKKDPFEIPQKRPFTSGYIVGAAIGFTDFDAFGGYVDNALKLRPIINTAYYKKRDLNCLKSIRHEFGLMLKPSYTSRDTTTYQITRSTNSAFFSLNYKFVYSYDISEYFSSTWNKGSGNNKFDFELGLDAQLFQFNLAKTTYTKILTDEIESIKYRDKSILLPGFYTGLTFQSSDNLGFNLGASIYPVSLFNFDKTTTTSTITDIKTKTKSRGIFRFNDFLPQVYFRLFF